MVILQFDDAKSDISATRTVTSILSHHVIYMSININILENTNECQIQEHQQTEQRIITYSFYIHAALN